MADIELIQGEEKTLTFSYSAGADCSSASMSLALKRDLADTTALVTKSTTDFTTSGTTSATVTVDFSSTDTNQTAGMYILQVKAVFSATSTDITQTQTVYIGKAVV